MDTEGSQDSCPCDYRTIELDIYISSGANIHLLRFTRDKTML